MGATRVAGRVITAVLGLVLATHGLRASPAAQPSGPSANAALYQQGKSAMRQSKWAAAFRAFTELERLNPAEREGFSVRDQQGVDTEVYAHLGRGSALLSEALQPEKDVQLPKGQRTREA